MHIHIATAGKVTEPILKGFKLIPGIEKVYLLYSGQYLESAEEISNYLQAGNTPHEVIAVQEYDFQDVMDKISRITEKEKANGPHIYTINVTGGTKLMAFAAYSSAYFIGATVYYVQDRQDLSLNEQIIPILTTKAPKNTKSDKKGRTILKFIYEKTVNNGTVTNQDIEHKFDLTKQQVSYYVKNMRDDSLITTNSGAYDPSSKTTNYRFNTIKLTQQGRMEALFTRNE